MHQSSRLGYEHGTVSVAWSDEDQSYVASVDIGNCHAKGHGPTELRALAQAMNGAAGILKAMQKPCEREGHVCVDCVGRDVE